MAQTSALAYCPVLHEIFAKGLVEGRSGKRHPAAAMSSLNNLVTLRNLHLSLRAEWTLEIGLRSGGSALTFTQTHKDLGSAPVGQHVSIDPFQRSSWIDESGLVAVEKAGLRDYLDFHEDYSCFALPKLFKDGRRFDLIYVDGSHLFEDVFVDFYFSLRLLTDDGVILFDDSANPHIAKVLAFIRSNMHGLLTEKDLIPFRPPGTSGLMFQAARMLGRSQLTAFQKVGDSEREWDARFARF